MRRPLILLAGSLALPGGSAAPPVPDVPVPAESQPLSSTEEARRDALTRYGVGLLRSRTDRLAAAAKQFEAAAKQTPTAAAPHKELAKVYAELGREFAAAAAGEKALAADPHDLDTARLLGRLYADARRHPDAVRVLKLAAASKELTDPVSKVVVLKDLAAAADAANDAGVSESARRDALAILRESRPQFLRPDLFTTAELERERAKLSEGIGHALVRKKEYAAAAATFEAARDLYASKPVSDLAGVARLHWNLSGVWATAGEPAKALAEVEKFLALKPSGFEPYERFVKLMKQLKRGDDLPARLGALADANPKNLAPRWLAAAEAMTGGKWSAGHDEFRKLADKGTTADEYRVLAAAYRDADRPKELLDLLDRAYKAARPSGYEDRTAKDDAPVNPDAVTRARLFTAAVRQLNPPFTARLVAQASGDLLRDAVHHTDTLELLSGLAARDGELRAMAGVLERAAGVRKKDVVLKGLTVQAFARLRDWERLADISNELSKSEDGRSFYPFILLQAAIAYAELDRRQDALRVFNDQNLGTTPAVQGIKVRVLNILGDHAAALAECEAALKNDRLTAAEQSTLLRAKATTLDQLGKFAEAEAVLRELLDADPDDMEVLNNLGYELADQNRKLDEAEALVRRAIALDDWTRGRGGDPEATNGGYADSLGWVLFRRGKLKEARELLERAVLSADASDDGIVWDHLGDVAYRQGEKKRAAEAWRKAGGLYAGSHVGRQKGRADEVKAKLKLAE